MKQKAKVSGIAAIYVACPNCNEDCENTRGSLLITEEDKEVSCVSCMTTWQVSEDAFNCIRASSEA